jgi:hypothetical protein
MYSYAKRTRIKHTDNSCHCNIILKARKSVPIITRTETQAYKHGFGNNNNNHNNRWWWSS